MAARSTRPGKAALQRFVNSRCKTRKVPGVAVGILQGGRETVVVSGVTSIDQPSLVTEDTMFSIGSTGKTFTATTVMRLVEMGKVGLDDPVVKHLPDFKLKDPKSTRALTIRHLLTHTGGWDGDDRIEVDWGWGDDAIAKAVGALRNQPQLTPVGTLWAYNNSGFIVAGRLIEAVTGKTFDQAVQELVLEPVGLTNSFYMPVDVATRQFAVGHNSLRRGPVVSHSWPTSRGVFPAGGLSSSIRDQLKWARFHLGDGSSNGKRILRKSTMALMQRQQYPARSFVDGVGISWLFRQVNGLRVVEHGGNSNNVHLSSFLMIPARKFAVTVLTNAGNGAYLHDDIEKWVLKRYLGIEDKPPEPVDMPSNKLADYEGHFRSKLSDTVVSVKGKRLILNYQINKAAIDKMQLTDQDRKMIDEQIKDIKPVFLRPVGPDRFITKDGGRYDFVRNGGKGKVAWMQTGGRLARRVVVRG